jgi:predicted membrane-bound spermidine synthase
MEASRRVASGGMAGTARSALVPGLIFFVSGFPALVYQLIWQRALFTIYGINVEAVTVVVTGFLLGLGLGSMAGGWLSARRINLLLAFGLIELAIAAVGVVSLPVLAAVGARTILLPGAATTVVTLLLLIVPTLLMGSTLPILTAYLVRRSRHVGGSVGLLYFLNTLGSALACFLGAFWLMGALGMQGAVNLAATLNLVVGLGGLIEAWRGSRGANLPLSDRPAPIVAGEGGKGAFRITIATAAISGFIALSYEIVWFRAFSLIVGTASAFAMVLGAFLIGVAFGSLSGRRFSRRHATASQPVIRAVVVLALSSSVFGFLLLPLAGLTSLAGLGAAGLLLLIALQTAALGAIFPLIAHYGIAPDRHAGANLSKAYFANILGSAAGALLTGFALMDHLDVASISALLAIAGLLLGLALLLPALLVRPWRVAAIVAAIAAAPCAVGTAFDDLYLRLIFGPEAVQRPPFRDVVETKSGIVTVTPDAIVYGGGYYDGRIEVELVEDRNHLARPLALGAAHATPRRVLMIGLATGAWAQVVLANPAVERLIAVEVNPGYLEVIRRHEVVAPLLANPRFEVVIDDGRRWLNRHPERRFDAIVQNTTWYYRANVTNLLSHEYLELVMRHLEPGGVFIYNTTYSARAHRTACLVAPASIRYQSAMIVGRGGLRLDAARLDAALDRFLVNGAPLFDMQVARHREQRQRLIDHMRVPPVERQTADSVVETCPSILARTAGLPPITDDNMGEEWIRLAGR